MKTWVRKTLSVGVLAAGALLLAPGAAHADVSQETWDNNGVGNGTQIVAPVEVPLNIVGNAIGVAGEANAAGAGWNGYRWTEGVKQNSSDNNGVANGTQAYLPINVPVNVVGNAVALLGEANANGTGVNGNKTESARTESGGVDQNSSDNNGVGNGTQIYSPIDIPINFCGNSLALLGEANSSAMCSNSKPQHTEGGWVSQDSSDNNGVGNGSQLFAPISLPVNLAGNSVAVLGEANSASAASNESDHEGGFEQNSSDNNGAANGTQIAAPISAPVNICGNALGILGEANASAVCMNGTDDDGQADDAGDQGQGDYDGDGDDTLADGDGTSYGSGSADQGGRAAHKAQRKAATERSEVSDLTEGLGAVNGLGLNLLNTLR